MTGSEPLRPPDPTPENPEAAKPVEKVMQLLRKLRNTLTGWAYEARQPPSPVPASQPEAPEDFLQRLPPIPPEITASVTAELIPENVAFEFRMLPVGGHLPHENQFLDACGSIRLLCPQRPTEEDRQRLMFIIPCTSFEYIEPEHPDFGRYSDIIAHFDDVLRYCLLHLYPKERTGVIGDD